MIARTESIQWIGHAVHIVKQFSDHRSPGGGAGQDIVSRQFETVRKAMLQLHGEPVVAGAIVSSKQRNVRRSHRQSEAGHVFVATILVNTLLMFEADPDPPISREIMFNAGAGLQRVWRVVMRINQRAL